MADEVQYSEIEKLDALQAWNARVMASIDKQDEMDIRVDGKDAEGDAGQTLQCEYNRALEDLRTSRCSVGAIAKRYDEKLTQLAGLEVKYELAMFRGDNLQRRLDMVEARFAALMAGGVSLIATERKRQMEAEGWTSEHDDSFHKSGELASAAGCYVDLAAYQGCTPGYVVDTRKPMGWPWSKDWWKPSTDPIRNLVKAGALIAAEIDRLARRKVTR